MIAQTGPDTIELLRCRNHYATTTTTTTTTTVTNSPGTMECDKMEETSSPLSVWQDETIEILLRQSLPCASTSRGSYQHQNSNSSNSASESTHPNGWKNNYQFLPIPDCCLQQFSQFTFVTGTGSRGIRMYRTETLEAVATFGENVQVHGKVAVWSRCAWIKAGTLKDANIQVDISGCNTVPANNSTNTVSTFGNMAVSLDNAAAITTIVSAVGKKKLPWWIERNDELSIRQREQDRDERVATSNEIVEDDEYWLIGIPHPYRGPSELKTTLYLWKPGAFAATENEATTTLQLPSGGCFGDYYVSSKCQRMVCVGADSSQLYVWNSALRTDFAGIMYPVGYKVITDNLEYIEDEDELDEVIKSDEQEKLSYDSDDNSNSNEAQSLDALVDADLAEAMRLSLLELQRQQSNELVDEKISVLCGNNIRHHIDDIVISPWPDRSWVEGNEPNSPGSPQQRHRALSNSSFMDCNDTFQRSFLEIVPHATVVRDEVKLMMQKRIQRKEDADNGLSILDKPKLKPKRARSANVEVLLQSSVDGNLRRQMDSIRAIWTDGAMAKMSIWNGSDDDDALDTHVVTSLSAAQLKDVAQTQIVTTSVTIEEKALAMELLHLTPPNIGKIDGFVGQLDNETRYESYKKPMQCFACAGRFVLHSCGIREKPIDYDEIARLEQEEKDREEEEKQKERMLKRRQAEAKRKETRRKKKEDNELKKIEECEQVNVNHQERINADGEWEQQRSFHGDYSHLSHPTYGQNIHYQDNESQYEQAEARATVESSNIHDTNYTRYDDPGTDNFEYSNDRRWGRAEQDSDGALNNQGSIHINGTEVKPSMSLHPMDALEALAGLAGSMAKPVPIKETVHNFNIIHTSADDDRYGGPNQSNGYGSHGFDESRNVKSPANEIYDVSQRYYSDAGIVTAAQESDESQIHVAPIAHVDYRDGSGGLAQLDQSLPLQQAAPVLTPPLQKPIIDPSLDQAMLLAEMAETTVVHGTHHFQQTFQTKSENLITESTTEHTYRPALEQSPEAEALLALAFSASPKVLERPTVQWSPSNELPQTLLTSADQTMYGYSPSSQRSCFGSTTSSTHAIVVSQFLQQPMAASLTNATYGSINSSMNSNNVDGLSDGKNETNTTSSAISGVVDDKKDVVSASSA